MPDISFYILPTESLKERDLFACKLIEKAYRSGVACYVLMDDAGQSQRFDDLLWTFRAGSFVPHQLYEGQTPEFSNVTLIGLQAPPDAWRHTVLNLSAQCPENFQTLGRILEILDNGETTKAAGRQRYRHYQQAGIEIATHKL